MIVDGSEHYLAVTLPSREHPSYAEVLGLLKRHGFLAEPSNGKWWLRDRHRTLSFLAEHGLRLRGEFGARFTPNFEKNTSKLIQAEVAYSASEVPGGYEVTLGLRAGAASEAEIRSALAAGRGYVEAAGQVVLFDADRIRRLGEAQRALTGQGGGVATRRAHRIAAVRAAEIESIVEKLSPDFQPPATWRARSAALRSLSALKPAPVPADLDGRLRTYQRLGTAWLWHLYASELAGILADEMGLGKTIQALALLAALKRTQREQATPSLVVCPASLLENWRREAALFAPELRTEVHHGGNRASGANAFDGLDLVLTSYGTIVRDSDLFASRAFQCVISDEAQHIKNRLSQNARALRSVKARGRFALTGTPLENSLDDLRSLFDFLLPGYLDRPPEGLRAADRAWADERLRVQAAPYILRRTKAAVAPELPEKLEQTIWCEMGPAQSALYHRIQEGAEREIIDLEASGAGEARLRLAVLTQLLRLRQACCDPRLVPGAAAGETPPGPYAESAKLEALRELLAEAADGGHRVLVFSQFTSLLALVREDLSSQGIACAYLDGSMPLRARQAEVDRFQSGADVPVFLLSLKAGGAGLNLTAADTVVHFDPWWNPAVEAQATDRAHRIGQRRVVTSYRLIAAGTVEEKVLGLQEAKRGLLAGVFEASDAAAARLSLADLKGLM